MGMDGVGEEKNESLSLEKLSNAYRGRKATILQVTYTSVWPKKKNKRLYVSLSLISKKKKKEENMLTLSCLCLWPSYMLSSSSAFLSCARLNGMACC